MPPFKSQPDFREVHAELSRNFRKKLRYNPGFPTSATYDGSHSLRRWVTLNFREKKILSRHHRETFAKPSLSMMVVLLCKFPYTDLSVNHQLLLQIGGPFLVLEMRSLPFWAPDYWELPVMLQRPVSSHPHHVRVIHSGLRVQARPPRTGHETAATPVRQAVCGQPGSPGVGRLWAAPDTSCHLQ